MNFSILVSLGVLFQSACRTRDPDAVGKDLILSGTSAESFVVPKKFSDQKKVKTRLAWLSLDALQYKVLAAMAKSLKEPKPKGLKWLVDQKNWNEKVSVLGTSITAPSHISTFTCRAVGANGIFANGHWNGVKDENGFGVNYDSETIIQSLRNQGLKVATVGYPSVDFFSAERSSSFGVSYDVIKSPSQFLQLLEGESTVVKVLSRFSANEYLVKLSLKGGKIVVENDLKAAFHDNWGLLVSNEIGFQEVVNLSWNTSTVSTLPQSEQTSVYFYGIDAVTKKAMILVAGASINQGGDTAFVKKLDQNSLMYSNTKDYSRTVKEGGPEAFRKSVEHRLAYFTSVAHLALDEDPDAFFLYLEDIDTLRHVFEGTPANLSVLSAHAASMDKALSSLFERFEADVNLVVMGDHGMSAIDYEVNVSALIPKDLASKYVLKSSGGALFVYSKDPNLKIGIGADKVTQDEVKRLYQALADAEFPASPRNVSWDGARSGSESDPKIGGKIFAGVYLKGSADAGSAGVDGPSAPWITALARPGYTVKLSVEQKILLAARKEALAELSADQLAALVKLNNSEDLAKVSEPLPLGSHGHLSTDPTMQLSVMFAEELSAVSLAKISNNTQIIDKSVAKLKWKTPAACQAISKP